ncbi:hypothetical protein ACYSNR_05630 [Enterococcus sp. LJL128]|uniref:hypothetical protein n=1 Tax=Enterococcus sp. LJL51 TaxID=3416656 RepID=UPI003CF1742E
MSICKECYSSNNRITPIRGAKECLETHTQYICGTCGRCICIEKDPRRHLQRWHFPFQKQETALLYLRTADVSEKTNCGIYQLADVSGRLSYKIFPTKAALESYLIKNKSKKSTSYSPVYQQAIYQVFPDTQIRRLTLDEAAQYLSEIS